MAWQEVNGFLFSCQYILWTFLRSDNFTHFLILREDINLKFLRSSISQKVCREECCKLGFEQIHNFFNALWSYNIYNFLFPIIFPNNSISTVFYITLGVWNIHLKIQTFLQLVLICVHVPAVIGSNLQSNIFPEDWPKHFIRTISLQLMNLKHWSMTEVQN